MKTNLKLNQSGRSMVEMLGVLAIIGVLSVAGIQGYTIAMNKHRANEILNEASKRAVVVAAQIASGRTPNLGEFPDNEVGGATFDSQVKNASGGAWSPSDSQFRIGFTKEPSEAVQKQMENIAGTNGMIQGFNGGLTYNNDLTAGNGTGAEGEAEPTATCTPACTGSEECVNGYCIAKGTSDGSCAKNSDCNAWCTEQNADKCYCVISADYLKNDSSCYNDFTGQCAVATTNDDVTAGGYIASSDTMTWWSAQNFCKAFSGKSMVSLSTLGITGGYQSSASCSGAACTGANWSTLKSQLNPNGNYYYWTKDAASFDFSSWTSQSGSNDKSCHAFVVVPVTETVGGGRSRNASAYALCK